MQSNRRQGPPARFAQVAKGLRNGVRPRWRDGKPNSSPPKLPVRAPSGSKAIVIGGGLAGAAAATVLAERGLQVTLLEREATLGGRAGAWRETLADGSTVDMERGFHGFFRQYKNVRALISRVDPTLSCLEPLTDYPLLGPNGAAESFANLPKRTPWNMAELVRRSPSLKMQDLSSIDTRSTAALLSYHPEWTYRNLDHVTTKSFVDGLNFPAAARALLLDVFSHSFFNPEESYSAAELLMMFHFYFLGNKDGLVFDVMREPFSKALWEPLEDYLQKRRVRILKSCEARKIDREGEDYVVSAYERGVGPGDHSAQGFGERHELRAGHLVLALPVEPLKALFSESPELGGAVLRTQVATLNTTNAFAVWRLWYGVPSRQGRAPFAATGGMGLLDNISLYHLFEGESRRWAERHGGSVVELHAYCLPDGASESKVREDLMASFLELYPEYRNQTPIDERFLIRRDCPAFDAGSFELRPGVETEEGNLALCGDFVKLPFPSALMERAVSSGFLAANAILSHVGAAPEPIAVPSTHGLLSPLARFLRSPETRQEA